MQLIKINILSKKKTYLWKYDGQPKVENTVFLRFYDGAVDENLLSTVKEQRK